jgi:putative membrane protein
MVRNVAVAAAVLAVLGGSAWAAAGPAAKPTDPQIAHIAYTAGQIDIAAGKQALAKSKTKAVRDFAQEMVRDHTAVNDQALALVKKLKVTPQDNPTSQALTKQGDQTLAELGKLDGAAFDRAYVQNEIAYHKTVNGALQTTLIPSAQNGELKSLLQTGLKLFTEHQKHAEHLAGGAGLMRLLTAAAVVLAAAATAGAAPANKTIVVDALAFGAAPPTLHVGDTVVWINRDAFVLSATAKDGSFDVELPVKGQGRTVLKKVGSIAYYCRYHPGMTGVLKVSR